MSKPPTNQPPSNQEEEYFARLEYLKLKKLKLETQAAMAQAERDRLKALHHMRCPKCGMELVEVPYRKIKIDKCTNCAGVWMDVGELEQVAPHARDFLGNLFGIFKS
ncbi:MAG: zf-TFIIB domain-containing protein [Planctomycetota bacterium]